jgi:hypothetical protein
MNGYAVLGMAKWLSATMEWALGGNRTVDQKRRSLCAGPGGVGRICSLIAVGVALSVLLAGCPDPRTAAGITSGCQREYGGVKGVDRPETSRLNCTAIDKLTDTMPGEPETFLTSGDSRRLLWKCKFYGTDARRILLQCEHDKRHFSIVKKAGN